MGFNLGVEKLISGFPSFVKAAKAKDWKKAAKESHRKPPVPKERNDEIQNCSRTPHRMGRFSEVRNLPGVYVLFDLDERPLYVGKSGKLRGRLEQHFIRQDSSATADGLLDIYDVLRVAVWYADPEAGFPVDAYEAAAYQSFPPRWNRAVPPTMGRFPY